MIFAYVFAGIAGIAILGAVIQSAVLNGIRRSGLIDWRTAYEMERLDEGGGDQPTLDGLYERHAQEGLDEAQIEAKVKEEAVAYTRRRTGARNAVYPILAGVMVLLAVGAGVIAAAIAHYDSTVSTYRSAVTGYGDEEERTPTGCATDDFECRYLNGEFER